MRGRGFGYRRRNNARDDNTNWNQGAVVRCACGGILLPPPANYVYDPSGMFLPLQPQTQLQEMPDALHVEGQLTPDLPLPRDPTVVVGGGPDQGISAALQPQPDSTMRSPEADLLPLQTSSARIDAPVASVQQPAGGRPLQPSRGDGGAGSSRRRRRYRTSRDRTVTRVQDGAPPPADTWAWRKYGQKAIKGSQYQRSYYRCSTDKECTARKYVDRCNNGSRCMIFSYSGEHSHAMPLVHNGVQLNARTSGEMLPLPPSPLVNVPAVEETRQDPTAPPPAIASASLSPPMPPRSPSAELDVEDYCDTMAVTMMLKDEDKSQDDIQFPAQEELAPAHHDGALGGGLVNNNNLPMPYENATGSSSNGDGSRMTAVQDPVANVVNDETFCLQPWDDSLFDWV